MRSVAGKTSRELQLDLPLSESPPDPTSSLPLTPASAPGPIDPGAESLVATLDARELDRPLSFPGQPEPVVETRPKRNPRETKLPVRIDTGPNRNPNQDFRSSDTTRLGNIDAPGVSRTLTNSSIGTRRLGSA